MTILSPTSDVVFAAHIPLLRIDSESIPFAGGDLWRMPFEAFNVITGGAFEDHADKYKETAPVFYRRVVIQPKLPNLKAFSDGEANRHRIQMKLPSNNWLMPATGLEFITRFHEIAADLVWLGLLLETPASLLPQPRWSITFAIADEGWGFEIGEHFGRSVSVQGDADMEYVMTPAFACAELPTEVIRRAAERAEQIGGRAVHAALTAALNALAHCTSPLLSPTDHETLATIALEALLLPEARGSLGGTLARRLGALLGAEADQTDALQQAARTLYTARSASLHGEEWPGGADIATRNLFGPRLLAGAIVELQARCGSTGDFGMVIDGLNRKSHAVGTVDSRSDPRLPPQSPRPCQPLQIPSVSAVGMLVLGTKLEAPEAYYVMWAPLVGLYTSDRFALGDISVVMPLSGQEVMLLEERDIARDFAARVRLIEEHIAALAIFVHESEVSDETAALRYLERQRDISVAALRLAGFNTFHDPELAGSVIVFRSLRFRQPSVLRQSTWQLLLNPNEHASLIAADAVRIGPHCQLLRDYQASPGHPDIERALSLYRRSYDNRFLDAESRAAMLFGLIEALLGRFRDRREAVQLEHLIARLLGPGHEAARWFASQARALRNDLAHGRSGHYEPVLPTLYTIVSAALPCAIRGWLDNQTKNFRPADLLIDALSASDAAAPGGD